MLHYETVESDTLSILRKLQSMESLKDFHLVGGTALSLLFGHRMSIDLDLFCTEPFNNEEVWASIKDCFGDNASLRSSTGLGIFGNINKTQIDIIRYRHPLIRPTLNIDNLRLYSAEEIIAMKVQAILSRARKKDFWDVCELLKHFSVLDFINLHEEKFSMQYLAIGVPYAITYFDDAEDDVDPISLKGQTWENVKAFINGKVRDFLVNG